MLLFKTKTSTLSFNVVISEVGINFIDFGLVTFWHVTMNFPPKRPSTYICSVCWRSPYNIKKKFSDTIFVWTLYLAAYLIKKIVMTKRHTFKKRIVCCDSGNKTMLHQTIFAQNLAKCFSDCFGFCQPNTLAK